MLTNAASFFFRLDCDHIELALDKSTSESMPLQMWLSDALKLLKQLDLGEIAVEIAIARAKEGSYNAALDSGFAL